MVYYNLKVTNSDDRASTISEEANEVKQLATEAITREVAAQIQQLVDLRTARAAAYGPQFVELWELATRCAKGGKLLRPRLLLGAFDALAEGQALEPELRSAALEIAAALELLHYSFLLHDDLIDEDLLRRGEPNLVGHLVGDAAPSNHAPPSDATAESRFPDQRRLHWARSSGLLIGDLMLAIAHQGFARARVPEARRIRILDLLDTAVTETVAGEYCDVGLADGYIAPDLSIVLDMTRMKTATYTFELPLRAAAVIADADLRVEQTLGEVGRHLGVAFQLQDDLLSAFGLTEAHGKDQFSDFREGKETALIAYSRMTNDWPSIEQLLGAPDFTDDSGRTIQHLLVECGARQFIESMVQEQIRTALEILSREESAVPAQASRFILTLVDSLDGRRV